MITEFARWLRRARGRVKHGENLAHFPPRRTGHANFPYDAELDEVRTEMQGMRDEFHRLQAVEDAVGDS